MRARPVPFSPRHISVAAAPSRQTEEMPTSAKYHAAMQTAQCELLAEPRPQANMLSVPFVPSAAVEPPQQNEDLHDSRESYGDDIKASAEKVGL
mmetsp:Transcript_2442/g.5185  ORF Transcript_2442/g.5185 Transcript_2442/m.5185 type:complete len:94 (+) Transcript_2442:24-305(+)